MIRAIGGGAQSDFRLQMKADVTGLPVEKPAVTEAAILGAATIAAAGAGQFASLAQGSAALYRCRRVFTPDRGRARQYQPAFARFSALQNRCSGEADAPPVNSRG